MTAPREPFMAAAAASLAAMFPARLVERGMQDPAALGNAKLRQGVFCLIAEGTAGWAQYTGREAENGTLAFAVVIYCLGADNATTLDVEQLEASLEGELLAWCQAIKPAPLDAVYPKGATYSRGLEAPLGWVVMTLEALYV